MSTVAEVLDHKVNSHAARPSPKAVLPFVRKKGVNNIEYLEYFGRTNDGQRVPYTMMIGEPGDTSQVYLDGKRVSELMDQFYKLEAQHDGLLAERDDLLARIANLEGQLERADRAEQSRKNAKKAEQK